MNRLGYVIKEPLPSQLNSLIIAVLANRRHKFKALPVKNDADVSFQV